jgi:Cof subfamily protein (haloacid dehalogenase superfamily)
MRNEKITGNRSELILPFHRRIRLIAVDMDETLLTTKKEISNKTWRALQRADQAGIQIVPVTGRNVRGLPDLLLQVCHYAVLMNGGLGMELSSGHQLFQDAFADGKTLEMYDRLREKFPQPISVFLEGEAYMQANQKQYIPRYELPGMAAYVAQNRISVPDLRQKILTSQTGANKFNILHTTQADAGEIATLRNLVCSISDCSVSDTGDSYDINPAGVDKGSGLRKLSSALRIPMEAVMAFGDAGNDIPMLREAGIGICMGNGSREAKEAADYITASNNEDGVAAVIEQLVP